MKGKMWTSDEDYICLCNEFNLEEIAELLDRSKDSVRAHVDRLKKFGKNYRCKQASLEFTRMHEKQKPLNSERNNKRWEPAEDEYILNHLKDSEISVAEYLGRTIASIRQRRYMLNKESGE